MVFSDLFHVRLRWYPLVGSLFLLLSPFFVKDGVPFWACSTFWSGVLLLPSGVLAAGQRLEAPGGKRRKLRRVACRLALAAALPPLFSFLAAALTSSGPVSGWRAFELTVAIFLLFGSGGVLFWERLHREDP